jgi:hypothetical protein
LSAPPRLYRLALLSVAVALAGCATPVRFYEGTRPAIATSDMPQALAYLEGVRKQYQSTVESRMGYERDLTNALVGAGAVALGLALGHVNTNAIAGVALGAGTAYTLGNINLARQPVLIYLAGIDALNCAEKAVLPLYINDADLKSLRGLLDGEGGLQVQRGKLAAALIAGDVVLRGTLPTAPNRGRLEAALAAGTKVLDASTATMQAGREFIALGARGSRELVATVTGIDTAVARAVVAETPDLSAVPGLVAGLAGTAGSFVPGAGIDKSTLDGLERKRSDAARAMTEAKGPDQVDKAATEVLEAAQVVAAKSEEVRSLLPSSPVLWPEDAFKNCGVAQVVSALSASTTAVRFTAGVDAQQEFEIYGGVKPYFVRIDGPIVDGLSVRSPVRFDNLAAVSIVGSKVKQALDTQLRVVDSSPTPRALIIPVSIVASGAGDGSKPPPAAAGGIPTPAPAKPAASTTPKVASPTTSAPGDDAARLASVANFKIDGRTFSLIGQPVDDGAAVAVTVKCPEGDVTLSRSVLARALLGAAGITQPKRHLKVTTLPATCAVD